MTDGMRRVAVGLALGVLGACRGAEGDTGGGGPVPEVAGRYNGFVRTVSGCNNDGALVSWADGPLLVTQTGGAVTFAWGDDESLDGAVASDGSVSASGEVAGASAQTGAFTARAGFRGAFTVGGDARSVAGLLRLEVDVDGTGENNCTVEADYDATELVGVD
jgi:hypothetical protein